MSKTLSVPERHQLKIAKDTLRMNDVGVSIMGGMSKDEARSFLRRIGWTDEQIAKVEGVELYQGCRIEPFDYESQTRRHDHQRDKPFCVLDCPCPLQRGVANETEPCGRIGGNSMQPLVWPAFLKTGSDTSAMLSEPMASEFPRSAALNRAANRGNYAASSANNRTLANMATWRTDRAKANGLYVKSGKAPSRASRETVHA